MRGCACCARGDPRRTAFAGFGDSQFSRNGTQFASVAATRGVRLRNLSISRLNESQPGDKPSLVAIATAASAPGAPVSPVVAPGATPASAATAAPVAAASAFASDWTHYGDLKALPDTREEILAIAQALGADRQKDVFLGLAASKLTAQSTDLSRRRIVAFATHGLIPGDLPGLVHPALALSALDDPKESPLLTLDNVLLLKLDADMVVLSACNTAAGDGQGAEAVSGLGRGFFYAGSRALLVTHWPVETVSARLLTTGLFERCARDARVTRAQALNASLLALMDETSPQGYRYAHPMFWAPYALIGDGGR